MAPRQQSAMAAMTSAVEFSLGAAADPKHARWLAPALLIVDAVLCALIIKTVDYTEIDWSAYMQQIAAFVKGERDYAQIRGDTGPLVYPAVHVYIYRVLYALTHGGADIVLAQCIFGLLYVANLAVVMLCYWQANAPPWVYPMLILSKRLHSIYLLRCFNDCFAAGFLYLSVFFMQRGDWAFGGVAFALGVGVKMTLLLALPAVLLLIYHNKGRKDFLYICMLMAQVQFLSSLPFTSHNAYNYVSRAFQFDRVFKYEWTVNWKFLSEETFLSQQFSTTLLVVHLTLLGVFAFTRWNQPLGQSPRQVVQLRASAPNATDSAKAVKAARADFILTTVLTAMLIGMLCARSLHFQFFAYIAWTTPFLFHKAKVHPALAWIIWAGQEASWNVFPPVEMTSKIVVGTLAAVITNVWVGTSEEPPANVEQMAERVLLDAGVDVPPGLAGPAASATGSAILPVSDGSPAEGMPPSAVKRSRPKGERAARRVTINDAVEEFQ